MSSTPSRDRRTPSPDATATGSASNDHDDVNGVPPMLLHENLARARHAARQDDAARAHRLRLLHSARRAARRAAEAERRARLASDVASAAAWRLAEAR